MNTSMKTNTSKTTGWISEQLRDLLRQAVNDSGMTRYAICKQTGLHQAALSRYLSGKGGMFPENEQRLAECLGLELVVSRKEPDEPADRKPQNADEAAPTRNKARRRR